MIGISPKFGDPYGLSCLKVEFEAWNFVLFLNLDMKILFYSEMA